MRYHNEPVRAYETLKTELLEHEEISDRKLSQFLRHFRNFGQHGDGKLRTIWLSRLPAHIKLHVVIQTI
ncbi:hypothetical protein ALC53_13427 [Atta colombica]|uniref:Uncharacterized protein n=1 Tax=Atta colombica TaxID=520822 RepID=A0A195AVF9_9HYME|nr:hypothetical protein ALC53_13427 [Atta colombica]